MILPLPFPGICTITTALAAETAMKHAIADDVTAPVVPITPRPTPLILPEQICAIHAIAAALARVRRDRVPALTVRIV